MANLSRFLLVFVVGLPGIAQEPAGGMDQLRRIARIPAEQITPAELESGYRLLDQLCSTTTTWNASQRDTFLIVARDGAPALRVRAIEMAIGVRDQELTDAIGEVVLTASEKLARQIASSGPSSVAAGGGEVAYGQIATFLRVVDSAFLERVSRRVEIATMIVDICAAPESGFEVRTRALRTLFSSRLPLALRKELGLQALRRLQYEPSSLFGFDDLFAEEDIPTLRRLVASEDGRLRLTVLDVLAGLGDDSALQTLDRADIPDGTSMRGWVAWMRRKHAAFSDVNALLAIVESEEVMSSDSRSWALNRLIRLGTERARLQAAVNRVLVDRKIDAKSYTELSMNIEFAKSCERLGFHVPAAVRDWQLPQLPGD